MAPPKALCMWSSSVLDAVDKGVLARPVVARAHLVVVESDGFVLERICEYLAAGLSVALSDLPPIHGGDMTARFIVHPQERNQGRLKPSPWARQRGTPAAFPACASWERSHTPNSCRRDRRLTLLARVRLVAVRRLAGGRFDR